MSQAIYDGELQFEMHIPENQRPQSFKLHTGIIKKYLFNYDFQGTKWACDLVKATNSEEAQKKKQRC